MIDRALSLGEFTGLVGITQQAVNDLPRRGVLKLNVTGQAWLIDYCAHLREEAAGRAGLLAATSSALKNSQRAGVDMHVAIKRREFMPVSLISEILPKVGRQTSDILEGLVHAVRLRWSDITESMFVNLEHRVPSPAPVDASPPAPLPAVAPQEPAESAARHYR